MVGRAPSCTQWKAAVVGACAQCMLCGVHVRPHPSLRQRMGGCATGSCAGCQIDGLKTKALNECVKVSPAGAQGVARAAGETGVVWGTTWLARHDQHT